MPARPDYVSSFKEGRKESGERKKEEKKVGKERKKKRISKDRKKRATKVKEHR